MYAPDDVKYRWLDAKIVRCPQCGDRIWEPRLQDDGCPTCKALESR